MPGSDSRGSSRLQRALPLLSQLANCTPASDFYSTMIPLLQVLSRLSPYPPLYAALQFHQLSTFFDLITRFRPMIVLGAPRTAVDLPDLPPAIREVLSAQIRLPLYDIDTLWSCLGDISLSAGSHATVPRQQIDRSLSYLAPLHSLGTSCFLSGPG